MQASLAACLLPARGQVRTTGERAGPLPPAHTQVVRTVSPDSSTPAFCPVSFSAWRIIMILGAFGGILFLRYQQLPARSKDFTVGVCETVRVVPSWDYLRSQPREKRNAAQISFIRAPLSRAMRFPNRS